MTSRCHILVARRFARRPRRLPEGLVEITSLVRDFQPLSDINQTNPYTQQRDGPIPVVTQAVQLLFGGLTVTSIPYRPVNQPLYHHRQPKCLHPTALETSSNGVVGTLRPEPDQAQTIIKVVFKFLSGLMPILTSNTHVTAYLKYL